MTLSMADRDRVRALQDDLIAVAHACGYTMHSRVSGDMPETIRLGDLCSYIYAEYEYELRAVLDSLQARSQRSRR